MEPLILNERQVFPCCETDNSDYKTYSECTAELGDQMYSIVKDKKRSYVLPYVCINAEGVVYVAAFKWMYTDVYDVERYIIRPGYRLVDSEEEDFLSDLDSDYICDEDIYKTFLSDVKDVFPDWNVVDYGPEHIGDMMEHIYFASHPGPKGVLARAQMLVISKSLNHIPFYNLLGRSPEEIIGRGLNVKMLRKLSTPAFVEFLFSEEKIQAFINAYNVCLGLATNQDTFEEKINTILNYQTNSELVDRLIRKQNEDCSYVYGDKRYIVLSATSIDEIIKEAVNQHTCLTNYLDSIACGAIRVLFLRRAEHMDKPFVSLIVRGSCIENVYDEYNRLPEIEIFEFLNKYKRIMGLQFDPYEVIQCAFEDMDYSEGYSQRQLDELSAYAERFK